MKQFKEEDGAIGIIVAVSLTLMLTFCALVVDLGGAYINSAFLQNAADAAAISAGKMLLVNQYDTVKMEQIRQSAISYANKNGVSEINDSDIKFSQLKNNSYTTLEVQLSKNYEYNFAKIIGKNSTQITKYAKVALKPVSGTLGAEPIGIEESQFLMCRDTNSLNHIVLKYGGGDGTEGVFGFVVLDGSNGDANKLLQWMCYGYDNMLYVGQKLPNATGNKASVAKQGVEYRMGLCTHYQDVGGCTATRYDSNCPRIAKMMIYKQISDREVEISGFAPFFIEGVDNEGNITGSYLNMQLSGVAEDNAIDAGMYSVKLFE